VGAIVQKFVVVRPQILIAWLVQQIVNLIQKEVSCMEGARFLFNFEYKNNHQSLFRGEPSTTNNFEMLIVYTHNFFKLVDASK
jgi:hypothetical protein